MNNNNLNITNIESIIIMPLATSGNLFLALLFLIMRVDKGEDVSQYTESIQSVIEYETGLHINSCRLTPKPFGVEFSCVGKRFHANLGMDGKVCCNEV